jgi:hypothetical protein
MAEYSGREEFLNLVREVRPSQSVHLLRVAGAVNQDAINAWAQLWGEFKPHVTPSGAVLPSMEKGFVPTRGWAEFLEQFMLLKHYMDAIARICDEKH